MKRHAKSCNCRGCQKRPLPPDVLASALQDRCHKETGKTRPGRSIRTPREAAK